MKWLLGVMVCLPGGTLSAQQPAEANAAPAQEKSAAASETDEAIVARLQKKAEAVVASVQKELDKGTLRQDVIKKVQQLDPLMQKRKNKEAEALLDSLLSTLGVDPKTVPKTPANGSPAAEGDAGPLPAFDPAGFTKIFDGSTLKDWDGDPRYWSVEDGKLVGTVTPETLLKKNSWIVWRGGLVEDFELVLDYRVSAQGNSGIGYRLAVLADDPFSVRGPQADIEGQNMFTGICYEENGRRLLAARGQSTWIDDPGGAPRLIAQIADPEELQGRIRKEEWNRYRLVVKGNDAQHFINGVLMSEVHDHDETNRTHRGLLGVQVHVGPPMTIEYRDIYLKHLGPQPEGDAARGSVVYRAGSLLEREHPPTFENLVAQTARLTAPATDQPVDGKAELEVVTRDLGVVRHDLVNVKLYGESKPQVSDEQTYDLVVVSGEQTIRVPGAGPLLIGKPLDRDYRVRLKWDAAKKQYEAIDLTPLEHTSNDAS